jgi:ferredoxin
VRRRENKISEEKLAMKARVDPDLCIGCGICPDVAPELFEMGSDDKAHTKLDPVPEELQAACKDAADQCPQAAIEVD